MSLNKFEIMEGGWENVSDDEKRFIKHVSTLEGLQEIWLVRDLGFADVWLVFSETTYEQDLSIVKHCRLYLEERMKTIPLAPKIGFLILTPENFTGKVLCSSIHLKRSN